MHLVCSGLHSGSCLWRVSTKQMGEGFTVAWGVAPLVAVGDLLADSVGFGAVELELAWTPVMLSSSPRIWRSSVVLGMSGSSGSPYGSSGCTVASWSAR